MKQKLVACAVFFIISATVSCNRKYIKDTEIPDTPENRKVLQVFMNYVQAVKKNDVDAILNLASRNYHDNYGTATAEDDVDYDALERFLKSDSYRKIMEVRPIIKIKDFEVYPEKGLAEVYYFYEIRAKKKMAIPREKESILQKEDETWVKTSDDMLLVLKKEGDGVWRIVSGM